MTIVGLVSPAQTILTGVVVLCGVLAAYRWMYRRSPRLALVVAVGVLIRSVSGVLLFAISFFHLPVFTRLQVGGGFWTLALDAHGYFNSAAVAAFRGIGTVSGGVPSAAFVRTLAAWMTVAGFSPASAVLFNLVCFVTASTIVVAVSGRHLAAAATALVALVVSPALVIFSTQALKESFSVLAFTMVLAGLWLWSAALSEGPLKRPQTMRAALAAASMAFGVYEIAGVRAYMAVFTVCAMVLAGVVLVTQAGGWRRRTLAAHVVLLVLLCVAFRVGCADGYAAYSSRIRTIVTGRFAPSLHALDAARAGFVVTGGATTLATNQATRPSGKKGAPRRAGVGEAAQPTQVVAIAPHGAADRFRRLAVGLSAMFLPISLVRKLSIASFSGGRGLLLVTDVDTVIMDLLIVIGLYLTFRAQPRFWSAPVIVFVLALTLVTALTMAYVVTNFGTLFRLRLLVAVPLWLLPAFVTPAGIPERLRAVEDNDREAAASLSRVDALLGSDLSEIFRVTVQ